MKDLLTQVLAGLKLVAIRALTSLKMWTVIIGSITTWLSARGVILSPDVAQYIAGFFGVLLLGQAATDHGKAAAQIPGYGERCDACTEPRACGSCKCKGRCKASRSWRWKDNASHDRWFHD